MLPRRALGSFLSLCVCVCVWAPFDSLALWTISHVVVRARICVFAFAFFSLFAFRYWDWDKAAQKTAIEVDGGVAATATATVTASAFNHQWVFAFYTFHLDHLRSRRRRRERGESAAAAACCKHFVGCHASRACKCQLSVSPRPLAVALSWGIIEAHMRAAAAAAGPLIGKSNRKSFDLLIDCQSDFSLLDLAAN